MNIHIRTNIDKFMGKFPENLQVVPRVGEFVAVETRDSLPFEELQVVKVTHYSSYIIVDVHLSELQHKEMIAYKLNVFE